MNDTAGDPAIPQHGPRLSCLGLTRCDQHLQFAPRFEADGTSRHNLHFGSSARITPDPCFSRLDRKHAEAAQFDAVARHESSLHALKYGIHGLLGPGSWKSSAIDHPLNQILLDHAFVSPLGSQSYAALLSMLESSHPHVNHDCTYMVSGKVKR